MDGSGNAYVAGYDYGSSLRTTPNAFQPKAGSGILHPFIAKIGPSGTIAYATYLTGSGGGHAYKIGVDASGAAYITGQTRSWDFPTTPDAFDTIVDNYDAFVVKLNPAGSSLSYSTFLGGGGNCMYCFDWGIDIVVDANGAAYITGGTGTSDFPTTSGAFDTSFNGGYDDAIVVKMAMGGGAIVAQRPPVIIVHGWLGIPGTPGDSCGDIEKFKGNNSPMGKIPSWLDDLGYDVYIAHIASSPLYTPTLQENAM